MLEIATHDGKFHLDELFGLVVFILIHGWDNVKIIRTRDPNVLRNFDGILVDVGDSEYDHHSEGSVVYRANGIPYASAGLVWQAQGHNLVSNPVARAYIERKLEFIDAVDNGFCKTETVTENGLSIDTVSLQSMIQLYNLDKADGFNKALGLVHDYVWLLIVQANKIAEMQSHVDNGVYHSHKGVNVLYVDDYIEPSEVDGLEGINLVIYPNIHKRDIIARPIDRDNQTWLSQFHGHPSQHLKFCHRTGYIAVFEDVASFWGFIDEVL